MKVQKKSRVKKKKSRKQPAYLKRYNSWRKSKKRFLHDIGFKLVAKIKTESPRIHFSSISESLNKELMENEIYMTVSKSGKKNFPFFSAEDVKNVVVKLDIYKQVFNTFGQGGTVEPENLIPANVPTFNSANVVVMDDDDDEEEEEEYPYEEEEEEDEDCKSIRRREGGVQKKLDDNDLDRLYSQEKGRYDSFKRSLPRTPNKKEVSKEDIKEAVEKAQNSGFKSVNSPSKFVLNGKIEHLIYFPVYNHEKGKGVVIFHDVGETVQVEGCQYGRLFLRVKIIGPVLSDLHKICGLEEFTDLDLDSSHFIPKKQKIVVHDSENEDEEEDEKEDMFSIPFEPKVINVYLDINKCCNVPRTHRICSFRFGMYSAYSNEKDENGNDKKVIIEKFQVVAFNTEKIPTLSLKNKSGGPILGKRKRRE